MRKNALRVNRNLILLLNSIAYIIFKSQQRYKYFDSIANTCQLSYLSIIGKLANKGFKSVFILLDIVL